MFSGQSRTELGVGNGLRLAEGGYRERRKSGRESGPLLGARGAAGPWVLEG